MSDSNFFGEVVAPGILIAGTGVSAYRTYKDVKKKGVVSHVWEAQKEQKAFFSAFRNGRQSSIFQRSNRDISQSFFFDSSKLGAAFPGDQELSDAMTRTRGHAIESLVNAFDLHNQARALGIDVANPNSHSVDAVEKLLAQSPAHRQHMEILARNNGLIGDYSNGNGQRVKDSLIRAAGQHRYDPKTGRMLRISDLSGVGGALEGLSPKPFAQSIAWDRHRHFSTSPSMQKHMEQLHSTISKLNKTGANRGKALSYRLVKYTGGGVEQISGMRIFHGNEQLLEFPFRQADGSARLGHYGQREMIGRMVKAPNFEELIGKGVTDPGQLYRPGHEKIMEDLYTGGLERIVAEGDRGKRFMRNLIGTHTEETNSLFLPKTLNSGLNRRIANQAIIETTGEFLQQHDRLVEKDRLWSPHEGLSPTQSESGVRNIENQYNHVFGSMPVGKTGDNKTIAQALRPKILDRMSHAPANIVYGKTQLAAGDQMSRVRVFSAPGNALNTLLTAFGRGDVHLHEDEFVLGGKMSFKEKVGFHLPSTSFLSENIEKIMVSQNPHIVGLRAHLATGIDSEFHRSHLEKLREEYKNAKDLTHQAELREAIEGFESLVLKGGDVLGLDDSGTYATVDTNAHEFRIEKMQFISDNSKTRKDGAGMLHIEGVQEERVGLDYKLFENKGTIKAKFSHGQTRRIAAIHQMVSQTPEYLEAMKIENADVQTEALRTIYEPHIATLNNFEKAQLAANPEYKGSFQDIKNAFGDTNYARAWEEALDATKGVTLLSVQGVKKMQERGMPAMVQGMVEELAGEAAGLEKGMSQLLHGENGAPGIEDLRDYEKYIEGRNRGSRLAGKPAQQEFELKEARTARREMQAEFAHLENRYNSILGIGLEVAPPGAPSEFLLDEKKADNIVETFHKTIDLTVKKRGRGMWSAKKLLEDLSTAAGMTDAQQSEFKAAAQLSEDKAANWFLESRKTGRLNTPEMRDAVARAIEPQLQYATINRTVSHGGSPAKVLGSGRPASINLQLIGHLNAQGGVMQDAGMELVSRIVGDKSVESTEMHRRASVFYNGPGKAKTISAADFVRSKENTDLASTLFSRNQEERSAAYRTVRERFGLEKDAPLILDFGEGSSIAAGGGRYSYHPEEISSHTGGYTNAAGKYIASDLDTATLERLEQVRLGNVSPDNLKTGATEYERHLISKYIGKDQAPLKEFSGKVQGSLRLQAKSQMSKEFFADVSQGFHNKVGISETHYSKMLTEAGLGETEIAERMAQLREGTAAGLIARQPGTELHRISNVQFFSMDEAIQRSVAKSTHHKSLEDLMIYLRGLDQDRHEALSQKLAKADVELNDMWEKAFKGRKSVGPAPKSSAAKSPKKQQKQEAKFKKWEAANVEAEAANKAAGETEAALRNRLRQDFGINYSGNGRDFGLGDYKRTQIQEAIKQSLMESHVGSGIYLPEQMEQILGADYDADQLEVFMLKDRTLDERLRTRASYQHSLVTGWQEQEADAARRGVEGLTDSQFVEQTRGGRTLHPEELRAEEDFLYKTRQRALYKSLKAGKVAPLRPEDVRRGSDEQLRRAAAEAEMARLEKGTIGMMTNNVDFARTVMRRQIAAGGSTSDVANMRIFGEMLLGVLPEAPLKARQLGAGKASDIAPHIDRISNILGNNFKGDMDAKVTAFEESFHAVYPSAGGILKDVASTKNIRMVLEHAETAQGQKEFKLLKGMKKPGEVNGAHVREMLKMLADPTIPSPHGESFRMATEAFGLAEHMGETQRHLKNAAATFGDVYNIFKKNKGPMLIGAGIAVGASMLLGSQGSISSEEADAAGARHRTGEPTTPPTDMGHSAPVQTGGKSIRVRGTGGAIDSNMIGEKIRQRFPGANMNISVSDYRNRINEEYIRRRMERG